MSEAVQIALITNATVLLVALLSRLWSRSEHKAGQRAGRRQEKKIDTLLNGKLEEFEE